MVYGWREGDRDMKTVLYVYPEPIPENSSEMGLWTFRIDRAAGWLVLTSKRFLTRDEAEKAGRGHEPSIDRVEFCRPPETKPVVSYPAELAAMKARAETAEAKVQELSRLPDQIEQVNRWHDWADATLGLISGRAISATEKQHAIALKIQGLKDRTRGPSILEQLILTWGDAPVGSGEYVRLPRLMYQAKVQELATTKTELAAARGLVRGLENDRDNWHTEAKRLREEKKALKVALSSFGL